MAKTICDNCFHQKVCKFSSKYDEFKTTVEEMLTDEDYPFLVDITCPEESDVHTKELRERRLA